jgi:hypothetical protein
MKPYVSFSTDLSLVAIVDVHNSNIARIWTRIFKDMCLEEIGLYGQNMLTSPGPKVNMIRGPPI